jgi:hypothetical protein
MTRRWTSRSVLVALGLAAALGSPSGARAQAPTSAAAHLSFGMYRDAREAFERARNAADAPGAAGLWREAGALYRAALQRAPASDEAPEAAINGAHAFKRASMFGEAIDMHRLFLGAYGSEESLARLERGDPRKYAERLRYVNASRETLLEAYIATFDYAAAAALEATIARDRRADVSARREAGYHAVRLHTSLGARGEAAAVHRIWLRLGPTPAYRAMLEYLLASAALEAWQERLPDRGANRAARLQAMAMMDRYFEAHRDDPAARWPLVRAAYYSAALRRAVHDPAARAWCRSTVAAFERYRASTDTPGSPDAEFASACAAFADGKGPQVRAGMAVRGAPELLAPPLPAP